MNKNIEEKARAMLDGLRKRVKAIKENHWLTAKERDANADSFNRCRYQIEILEEILK